mgnify:CR=1 FL=1
MAYEVVRAALAEMHFHRHKALGRYALGEAGLVEKFGHLIRHGCVPAVSPGLGEKNLALHKKENLRQLKCGQTGRSESKF